MPAITVARALLVFSSCSPLEPVLLPSLVDYPSFMPSSSLVWLLVELDWFLAGRTLYLFDQPAAQANQMEDVPTAEYFAFV